LARRLTDRAEKIDAENQRLTDHAEGAESKLEEGARRLMAAGMPIAQIAEVLNLSIEKLRDLE
jgi:DNA-binding CsgD family transcriptional regulator